MTYRIITGLLLLTSMQLAMARDFEDSYAVYGAGADNCALYLDSMKKGGKEQDYFIDWTIGYLSAFNVIMPNTYNVLGETDFPTTQRWLERHCLKYPRELFINAVIKLTEVLYPMRYQSGLKNPPSVPQSAPVRKPAANLKDVSKAVK